MSRLGELDLPDRLAPTLPVWVTQVGLGVLCAAAAIVLRGGLEMLAPGGAPFALIFPAMMLATLLARWQSGAIVAVLAIAYAWTYGYRATDAWSAIDRSGLVILAFVSFAALITIAVAELFRRAARRAMHERDMQISDRDLLLQEIDHRMKNNFSLVTSILDIQKRRADGEAAEALGAAQSRVESIARAHRHLYRGSGVGVAVGMQSYLGDLCEALANALLLRDGVTLTCSVDQAEVARDRAVSIGLVVNELVTNAAKHAFTGRTTGSIAVGFRARPGGWTLIVSDDGVGLPPVPKPSGPFNGLGSRLIPAFARQAGGTLVTESGSEGTTVTMEIPH